MSENNYKVKCGKGFAISSQLKIRVLKKYNELKKVEPKLLIKDIISTICKEFIICEKTYYNIINNGCVSPKKKRIRKCKFSFNSNDYTIIDDIICKLNKQKICVYINDVFNKVKSDPQCELSFKGCRIKTFYKILKQMHYKYSNTKELIRNELKNTERVRQKIIEYLLEKRRLERLNPNSSVVYIDETFEHINNVPNKTLTPIDVNKQQKFKKQIGKGTRFSIINAGSLNGFVPNAEFIVSKTELNAEKFENWLQHYLLPNIPAHSIVIFDNCSTHSRQYNKTPTQCTTVGKIKEWLTTNSIEFDLNLNKRQLLEIVKQHPKNPQYYVDDMIRSAGHLPLRLPPYCCELNPVELIWNTWKQFINHNNFNNNHSEFKKLLSEAFKQITPTVWADSVRHVIREFESQYWIKYNITEIPVISDHNYFFNYSSL
jgi:transposase